MVGVCSQSPALQASLVQTMLSLQRRLRNLVGDDTGQDLVEYAILGAFIGVVSVLVWRNISSLIGDRYAEYNSNVNTLWASPEPP